MNAKKHDAATDYLDRVADEHDPPLGHRVSKGADEGGQQHIGKCKESFEQRLVLRRRMHFAEGGDRCNQESVVGQRRKKLCCHDYVEAEWHLGSCLVITLGDFIPRIMAKAGMSHFV